MLLKITYIMLYKLKIETALPPAAFHYEVLISMLYKNKSMRKYAHLVKQNPKTLIFRDVERRRLYCHQRFMHWLKILLTYGQSAIIMVRIHFKDLQTLTCGQSYDRFKAPHVVYMLQTPQTPFRVLKDHATCPSQRAPKGALHAMDQTRICKGAHTARLLIA